MGQWLPGPWAAPVYRDIQTASIDVNRQGLTPVMQLVDFGQPLTLDERVGIRSSGDGAAALNERISAGTAPG